VPADGTLLGGQLHPAAIAVWSLGQAGAILVLFLINPASPLFALPFIALIGGLSAIRYARFRWHYARGVLVIEQGLINRQRRVIPVERVQSVDLVRRISHRLFGVTAVQVEAIGSGDTEGKLDALSLDVANRLRETLLAGRAVARGEPAASAQGAPAAGLPLAAAGEVLATVPNSRLLVAGATEANATLLAAVAGGLWQLFGDRFDDVVERLPGVLAGNAVVFAVIAALVAALLLLIAAQVVLYWNFELRRTNGELQVRRGLLEQRFDTVPLRRVQAVRVEENLPRRLFGLAAVRADIAGKPGGGSGGTDTLLPIGSGRDARALAARVLDEPRLATVTLARMPARARNRRLFKAAVATLALTGIAVAVWGWPGLAAALVGLPAAGIAQASYRALGHAELPGLAVTRSGWWVRRTAFVPEPRLQTLALRASVFQRWRRLATLELHIARSPGLWSGPQMIDLDRDVARALVEAYAPVIAAPRGRGAAARAARLTTQNV
jgi:putative membrane protein